MSWMADRKNEPCVMVWERAVHNHACGVLMWYHYDLLLCVSYSFNWGNVGKGVSCSGIITSCGFGHIFWGKFFSLTVQVRVSLTSHRTCEVLISEVGEVIRAINLCLHPGIFYRKAEPAVGLLDTNSTIPVMEASMALSLGRYPCFKPR